MLPLLLEDEPPPASSLAVRMAAAPDVLPGEATAVTFGVGGYQVTARLVGPEGQASALQAFRGPLGFTKMVARVLGSATGSTSWA